MAYRASGHPPSLPQRPHISQANAPISHHLQGSVAVAPALPPRGTSAQSASAIEELPPPELDFAIPTSSFAPTSSISVSKPPPLPPRESSPTAAPPPLPDRKTQSSDVPAINHPNLTPPTNQSAGYLHQQPAASSQPPSLPLRPAVAQDESLAQRKHISPPQLSPRGPDIVLTTSTPQGNQATQTQPIRRALPSPASAPTIQIEEKNSIKQFPTEIDSSEQLRRRRNSSSPEMDNDGTTLPPPALPKRDRRPSAPNDVLIPSQLPPNPIPRMIAEQKRIEVEKSVITQTLVPNERSAPLASPPSLAPKPTGPGKRASHYVGGKSKSENFADMVKSEIVSASGDTGTDVAYSAVLEDAVRQAELMGSEKKFVIMYRMRVAKGGKSWTIFRRFNQFFELDKKLRHHGLWPKDSKLMPPKDSKRAKDDTALIQERKEKISYMMQQFLSKKEIQDSSYLYAFLEPVQLGDIKPSD